MFIAPSMIAAWYGPQMPTPTPGRALQPGSYTMVSRGMDTIRACVCVGSRWTSSRLSELLVFRLGLLPNPLPWPFLVCEPSSRMFCAP